MIDLSGNKIDDETADDVSHLILNDVEEIDLSSCDLSSPSIKILDSQTSKLINPVS